jgi:hypothetical protein
MNMVKDVRQHNQMRVFDGISVEANFFIEQSILIEPEWVSKALSFRPHNEVVQVTAAVVSP